MPSPNGSGSPSVAYALRVFRVAENSSWRIRLLSTSYSGLLTHYTGSGSVWCNPDGCLSPHHKKGPIWKGYCTADLYDEANRWWAPIVFEMTETCELDFRDHFKRGQIWLVERGEVIKKATGPGWTKPPVRASLIGEADLETLPAAPDYMPVLRSVYHAFNLTLGVKNPMPARVMVSPTLGDAPPDLAKPVEPVAPKTLTMAELEEKRRLLQRNGTH